MEAESTRYYDIVAVNYDDPDDHCQFAERAYRDDAIRVAVSAARHEFVARTYVICRKRDDDGTLSGTTIWQSDVDGLVATESQS